MMKRYTNVWKNLLLVTELIFYTYLVFLKNNRFVYEITYTKCIVLAGLISLFIYIYGLIANEQKAYTKNLYLYIGVYFLLLISVVFFIGRTDIRFYNWWYAGQYKPFNTIISQVKYGSSLSILKNIVGNGIMLMPLSFLLMVRDKKYSHIFKQSLIVLPTIISVELLQAFTHTGAFDIDDILLNYLGTLAFTFIITRFSLIDKIRKLFYSDFTRSGKVKITAFYLLSIIIILYSAFLIL